MTNNKFSCKNKCSTSKIKYKTLTNLNATGA